MTAIAATETGPRRVTDPRTTASPDPVLFATAATPAALTVDVRWETPAGHPLVAPPVLAIVHGTYGHTLAPSRPLPGQRPDDQPAVVGVRHEQVHGDGHPVAVAARVCVRPAELAPGTDRVLLLLETGAGAVRVRAGSELTAEPVVAAIPVHTSPAVLLAELVLAEDGWTVRAVGRGLPDGVDGLLRALDATDA